MRTYQTIIAAIALLFAMQGAQAGTIPTAPFNFGTLANGDSASIDGFLPDGDDNIAWFD